MPNRACLLLVLVLLGGCGTTSEKPAPPSEAEVQRLLLVTALRVLEDESSAEAEAAIAAAGDKAVPHLLALLEETSDSALEDRVRSLLLYAGEDMDLTLEEQVDLLLHDLARDEPHPYLRLKAIDRIRSLGKEAIPPLQAAASREDEKGRAARRLLSRMREVH
ncbi:MAG: hypothetical protein ACYTDY_12605 [Planctomycetota bacterium]|jgi:hypothetical protein